ncbi:DegT/DnrJ/EryC1/StrS family aminotransferase [Dethiosulfovibrio sp. F2B]|uniref:DegT/DnrJ/EryC1/StrS family aminotransferase n=1 Tax=Dethiosulfovibrio faecalis TaxID=2720018 RepID=UPI001F2A6C71|nr:DegT/DnrJ/EryC1/StrS family aminotransferase [Dethiosulfovibrio faecalis]MCF4151079.1 DegT/DnrJ/EryC1/StrS family aminotransferase [Dethiosulfovibrio faecalis]
MPGFEFFDQREIDAVADVIGRKMVHRYSFNDCRDGIYRVEEFENAVAEMVGSRFCLAVSSGTAALYVGLKAMGIEPGDRIITSPFTFIATVEAMAECGAVPVFADVDESLNMDPRSVESLIDDRTKAVMPVHMFGSAADMDPIAKICSAHGLKLLEDSCQAMGATYKGRYVGTIGAWGSYSLDPYKLLTVGEGGLVVTDDEELYRTMEYSHDHGHVHDKSIDRGAERKSGLGMNFRMSEIQGAIGLVQVDKMLGAVKALRENKAKVLKSVGDVPGLVRRSFADQDGEIATQLVYILPDGESAKRFQAASAEAGVGCGILSGNTWHYARHWDSLRDWAERSRARGVDAPEYLPEDMAITEGILSRAVVYGIRVTASDESLETMAKAIKAGAAAAL